MKITQKLLSIGLLMVVISGCENSSGGAPVVAVQPSSPSPTDFSTFVVDQFAATSDTTDAVDVDEADFSFADDENPHAFDSLIQ